MSQLTVDKKTGAEAISWDLSDLFSAIDDPRINEILKTSKSFAEAFAAKYKGKVKALTDAQIGEAYLALEELLTPLYKVSQFASLVYSTDTSNEAAKALDAKIDEEESYIGNILIFFDLEIGTLDREVNVANYGYQVAHIRKTAKFNLSEKEEQAINLKNLTGARAFKKMYSELTSSFKFKITVDGKEKEMNGSELRALREHEDKNVRRQAMKLFFERYKDNKIVVTHVFNNILKSFNVERKLRGYPTPINVRNVGNDLDDKAVEALHDVTTESYRLVQRYYKLKAKILNLPDLGLADIYAPMPKSTKDYTWDEAKAMVLEGFRAFDEEFYTMAKRMFDENRIDGPIRPNKRGGAFCSSSTPDVLPYVMLNFLGRARDVSTMAHELGHAIHDMLCSKQTLINYHPILPLAETASVFCEMIITDLVLKREKDPVARQALLTDKLEDIFATSHRQNMFSRFEMATHEKLSDGILSSEEYSKIYKEELKKMFGDSVVYPDEFDWEWSSIPHMIDYPFYVYSYNFGNLLVMALYQQYKDEGKSFVPKLKNLLALGSSKSPDEITATVQADIRNPEFWRKSLRYIQSLIDELESLTK